MSMYCHESELIEYQQICPYCQQAVYTDTYGRCENCGCDIIY